MVIAGDSKIGPKERLGSYQDQLRQARERFHQLEQIEWKINFSIWGAIGGLSYIAMKSPPLTPEPALKSPLLYCFIFIPFLIHLSAVWQLNRQQQKITMWRQKLENNIDSLLGTSFAEDDSRRFGGLRLRDWFWAGFAAIVTVLLSAAAIYLLQHSSPK